jgi:hypothetical protein
MTSFHGTRVGEIHGILMLMLTLTLMRIPKHLSSWLKVATVVILRQGTWEGGWI